MSNIFILDENNNLLQNGSLLDIGSISVKFNYTLSLYIISKNQNNQIINSIIGKIVSGISGDEVYYTNTLSSTPSYIDNKYVTPIHIVYNIEEESEINDIISINDNFSIRVKANFVEEDERLQILLNNMGKKIDLDWYRTFTETGEVEDVNILDREFLNKKRKELLLDLFTLTQLKGSYENIHRGINFFGYGGLIDIIEYWIQKSDNSEYIINKRDGLAVKNSNLDYLSEEKISEEIIKDSNTVYGQYSIFENSENVDINEYIKTNYIALRYHINVQDKNEPFDEDGIPNMVQQYLWNDFMFVKLTLLKKVLQEYFLPDDIKIIDIIGDYTSFTRYCLKIWINQLSIIRLNKEHSFNDLDIVSVYESDQYLQEKKLIVDLDVYEINTSDLELESYHVDDDGLQKRSLLIDDNQSGLNINKTYEFQKTIIERLLNDSNHGITLADYQSIKFKNKAHSNKSIYRVIKDENELNTQMKPWEFVTGFWRGDCAIIGVELNSIIDSYNYAVSINQKTENGYDRIYYTGIVKSSEIKEYSKFAILNEGKYLLSFYSFDRYGAIFQKDFEFDCKYPDFIPTIQAWKPKYIDSNNKNFIRRDIIFDDIMETNSLTSEYFAIDLSDQNYNVNDPDYGKNNPDSIIRRYQTNSTKNQYLKQFNLVQMRNIKLSKLNSVPLSEYSDGYEVLLFDIEKFDFPSKIKLELFESDRTIIEAESPEDFITKINTLSEDNIFRKYYTFDYQPVLLRKEDNTFDDLSWKILLFAKERGTKFSLFKLKKINSIDILEPEYPVLEPQIVENFTYIDYRLNWNILPYFSNGPSMRLYKSDVEINNNNSENIKYDWENGIEIITKNDIPNNELYIKHGLREYSFIADSLDDIFTNLNTINDLYVTCDKPTTKTDIESISISSKKYGSDLLIQHKLFGRRFEPFRKSPIQYLYKAGKGESYDPGTYFFATVDLEWKFDNYNISWKIYEHFSQNVVFESNDNMVKFTTLNSGIYDIELSLIDKRTLRVMRNKIAGYITYK